LDLERKADRVESPVPLLLSSKQVRHAQLVLERSKQLSQLRNDLCPRFMDDDVFWKVYFLLVRRLVPLPNYDMRESAPSLQRSDSAAELLVDWNVQDDDALRALCEQHTLPNDDVRRTVYRRLLRLEEQSEEECNDVLLRSYHQRFGIDAPQEILFPPRVNRFVRTEDMVPHSSKHRDAALRIVTCMALEQCASPQVSSSGESEIVFFCSPVRMTGLSSLSCRIWCTNC
jgi:hypothetical protein